MTFNDAVNEISNSYYSLIPHNFGRTRPTVIRDEALLKKEIELLESLTVKPYTHLLSGRGYPAYKTTGYGYRE